MIPALREINAVQALYLQFLNALKQAGFRGDTSPSYASRTVLATDNSIYQVLPQAVVYPRDVHDLQLLMELAEREEFHKVVLSPRGGGTGTNGQSLTDGLVVDISRHMNRILEINPEEGWVRVQAGVVKDQLNAALKPHGLFFAPELSTSNRATIGGMINTDASGQGSCVYGKTRDHVLELSTVVMGGTLWQSHVIDDADLAAISEQDSRVGKIHRTVEGIHREKRELIDARFPKLNRCLTGYDLAHIRDSEKGKDGRFNLNNILCGSEGTLGFIAEAKLNLLKIPKCAALVNLNYDHFQDALKDASDLMKAGPTSIETVDSKVLQLAMGDIVWDSVSEFFPQNERPVNGINLVEYTADSEEELDAALAGFTAHIDSLIGQPGKSFGYTIARGHAQVNRIWGMRKRAVGLLGNAKGEQRPIPFVEDCAVPPENLADFIAEFRAALDEAGFAYGMFGHVDAGVLHVRPAIDMKDPEQARQVRVITEKVVELAQKYNGLLWGEHGKGVRSEFAPAFFGELYLELQKIKAAFDPRNQLNPGKIATPSAASSLLKIDEVPTRGEHDRRIPVQVWEGYSEGVYCNGNGACFNWNPDDAMCPSYKGTRNRIHSPKGRASLIREWLRLLADRSVDPEAVARKSREQSFIIGLPGRIKNSLAKARGEYDFSHEVNESMQACLACKSCAGQCPIKVDVPTFRAKFLELYYSRYLRPLKDYFVGSLEFVMPHLARVPQLYNLPLKLKPVRWLLERGLGLADSPSLSATSLDRAMRELGVPYASRESLCAMGPTQRAKAVVIVQDAFTSYFDADVVADTLRLLKLLDFNPLVAPFRANGKPLHVHGFLRQFAQTAAGNSAMLNSLAEYGVPLVGIDPSMTLTYRGEYQKLLGDKAPKVLLLQEWLAGHTDHLATNRNRLQAGRFTLLPHCTEQSNAAGSGKQWQEVFAALGMELNTQAAGCCGMAGTYGHEVANRETSRVIFQQSWAPKLNGDTSAILATGYSCRCQSKRFADTSLRHPLQALLAQIEDSGFTVSTH
ncbi:FAD-binding and (Fe-S)-binding domain-containing protein [Microbulbifer harenosus]|uniref:FAD-binding oxidoreductase n=1 Tax=Microbulbifer harenosus TaxID=2576840 RepID=A0ABY2UG08_9GAMM|nr:MULTISPECIES: FAD-binding and (Fe-S)-binding domain-containing protein [Microbulbifer]QIL91607.1 FAD-binding protein [Microbulbifer sp. SH-1]TLM76574.1 FAD-binding oxidoreductase [Microbulbifer harenosus]